MNFSSLYPSLRHHLNSSRHFSTAGSPLPPPEQEGKLTAFDTAFLLNVSRGIFESTLFSTKSNSWNCFAACLWRVLSIKSGVRLFLQISLVYFMYVWCEGGTTFTHHFSSSKRFKMKSQLFLSSDRFVPLSIVSWKPLTEDNKFLIALIPCIFIMNNSYLHLAYSRLKILLPDRREPKYPKTKIFLLQGRQFW